MKIFIQKTLIASVFGLLVALTAHAEDNPLSALPKHQVVKFLEQSSSYATKKMSYTTATPKTTYDLCMTNTSFFKDKNFCQKFFVFMQEYAQKRNKKFSGITVENLQDKKFFASIEQLYLESASKATT